MIVPAYIAEMSPARIRGGPVVLRQLAVISGGILLSYALDFAFDSAGWGWRPMFGFAVLAALALAIVFVWRCVPETRGRPLEHIDEYWANGRRWPAEHRDRAA